MPRMFKAGQEGATGRPQPGRAGKAIGAVGLVRRRGRVYHPAADMKSWAWRLRSLVLLMAAMSVLNGCGGGSSPASPSAPSAPIDLAGMWAGSASDSSGPGLMSWQLTQSGGSFSGTAVVSDPAGARVAQGTVSGTLSGSALQFSIAVPAGGFNEAACTASVTGSGAATATTITGTYSGTQSCSGAFTSGSLTLSKQ